MHLYVYVQVQVCTSLYEAHLLKVGGPHVETFKSGALWSNSTGAKYEREHRQHRNQER